MRYKKLKFSYHNIYIYLKLKLFDLAEIKV